MAKITFKLDTRRPLQDGTYPLTISISHQGKTVLAPTGFHYTEAGWAEARKSVEGKKLKGRQESIIAGKKLRLDIALLTLTNETDISVLSVTQLRDRLVAMAAQKEWTPAPGEGLPGGDSPLFLPYFDERMNGKATKGTKAVYARTRSKIIAYEDSRKKDPSELTFADITPAWLLGLEEFMKPTDGVNSRGIIFRSIRSVFNDAREDRIVTYYPFSRKSARRVGVINDGKRLFKIEQDHTPTRRALSLEQLRSIRDFPVPPHQEKYRDLFMLMIYLIGINAVDLLTARPSQLRGGRLYYVRKKTGENYSIKVEPEAMEIIKRYKGKNFLLNPCDRNKNYSNFLHRMNDQLKLIGVSYANRQRRRGEPICPGLTTYWARHTWTSIGVNNGMLQYTAGKGLGHAWARDKVTDMYISLDEKIVDEANRKLIDLINADIKQ